MVTEDIETYTAIRVDIGVIDSSGEVDFWWLEWVVGWEMDG